MGVLGRREGVGKGEEGEGDMGGHGMMVTGEGGKREREERFYGMVWYGMIHEISFSSSILNLSYS